MRRFSSRHSLSTIGRAFLTEQFWELVLMGTDYVRHTGLVQAALRRYPPRPQGLNLVVPAKQCRNLFLSLFLWSGHRCTRGGRNPPSSDFGRA